MYLINIPNPTLSNFDDVGEFHRKFGLASVTHEGVGPREPDPELLQFRLGTMREELDEYEEALEEGDDAKAFDSLIDLVYFALGTAHIQGFPWQAGWLLVQQANMAKQRSESESTGSERGSSWDVVKPIGWQAPDIEGLLFNSGWFAEPGETLFDYPIISGTISAEAIVANKIGDATL